MSTTSTERHSEPRGSGPSHSLQFSQLLTLTKLLEGISKTVPSHDTSFAAFHVTQTSLLRQLDLAVQAAWASRHGAKYANVKVLLTSWESDDLGVKSEVQRLESVFQDLYHFDVESWEIPDRNPGLEITSKVLDLKRCGSTPDTLLIFYYAGHASLNGRQPGSLPIWFANREPKSPKLDSSCVQPLLCEVGNNSADILLLYDCCQPANGHGTIESSNTSVELLAACGFEARAAEVGEDSFTHCLVQELSDAVRRKAPISIPELHCLQISRLQAWKPDVEVHRDTKGKERITTTDEGIPIFQNPVRRTPIYCRLSLNDCQNTIRLSPLPRSECLGGGVEFATLTLADQRDCSGESNSKRPAPELQVVLCVRLEEDEFNEEVLKEWITSAPAAAKSIRVLGALPSCSTMLFLQVPMEVWSLMPTSPAVTFLGFVPPATSEAWTRRSENVKSQNHKAIESWLDDECTTSGGVEDDESTLFEPESKHWDNKNTGMIACLFNKYDPIKHRRCQNYKFRNLADIRVHLRRIHSQPLFCATCKAIFHDRAAREEHRICQSRSPIDIPDPPGIKPEQWSAMISAASDSASKNSTIENQWFKMWDNLFPGIPRPKSIFNDQVVLTEEIAEILERFVASRDVTKTQDLMTDNEPQSRQLLYTYLCESVRFAMLRVKNSIGHPDPHTFEDLAVHGIENYAPFSNANLSTAKEDQWKSDSYQRTTRSSAIS